MTVKWTRRQVLGSALAGDASLAAGGPAFAAAKTLNVLAHRVHQNSLTTGVAGDLTKPWRDAHDDRSVPLASGRTYRVGPYGGVMTLAADEETGAEAPVVIRIRHP